MFINCYTGRLPLKSNIKVIKHEFDPHHQGRVPAMNSS